MVRYNQPQPPTNLESCVPGIPSGSTFYDLHVNPSSGSGRYPIHANYVPTDHLPSSSNHRGDAFPMNGYARNNSMLHGFRCQCKRKNADAIPGNAHYYDVPAEPSLLVSPASSLPVLPATDHLPHAIPEYRDNVYTGRNRVVGAEPLRSSAWTHNYNHQVQGNFIGQAFQPSSLVWIDHQSIDNSGIGGALPRYPVPLGPSFPGSIIHGASAEVANFGPQGFYEAGTHRGRGNFMHSAPMVIHPHNVHPQGMGGFPVSYPPPLAMPPAGHLYSNLVQRASISIYDDASPPTEGFWMEVPHRRPNVVPRHQNEPYISIMPANEVAMVDSRGMNVADNAVDHWRDMRLDIEGMSYEGLLHLCEQIGNVRTLSKQDIAGHLKTRSYYSTGGINLEELQSKDQRGDFCAICQDHFGENDRLGSLDCGHVYHEECLRQWLQEKNVCPICRSTALTKDQ